MAEDADTQTYEIIWVELQNFNVKTLPSYAVTMLDLAKESKVWTKVIRLHNISIWKYCKFSCLQQRL